MNNSNNSLQHHGILGQKWGVRRFQNEDGSLTPAGRERYGVKLRGAVESAKSYATRAGQRARDEALKLGRQTKNAYHKSLVAARKARRKAAAAGSEAWKTAVDYSKKGYRAARDILDTISDAVVRNGKIAGQATAKGFRYTQNALQNFGNMTVEQLNRRAGQVREYFTYTDGD